MIMRLNEFWQDVTRRANARLDALLLGWDDDCLRQAACHAFKGGKRLRPLLVAASSYALDIDIDETLPLGVAVECLHTFSLVHDDLPGMDNDTMRRGVPSVHTAFGEGTAILVGDALLTLAFDVLLKVRSIPRDILQEFTRATLDMIRGQALDGKRPDNEKTLMASIALKTGSIIRFCVLAPGLLAQAPASTLVALKSFAHHFGLLYQLVDDVCDDEGCIYLLGRDESLRRAQQQAQLACEALEGLDTEKTRFLYQLATTVWEQLSCQRMPS